MPIRAENRSRYPKDWPRISLEVRAEANFRCEFCGAANAMPHPITGSKVVLTVAHLDHTPENCDRANLKALCQKCHNAYDAPVRRAGIKAWARQRSAAGDLLEVTSSVETPE